MGGVSECDTHDESPLPPSAVAGEGGGVKDLAVFEGPLISALLNKVETILDQVCVCAELVCTLLTFSSILIILYSHMKLTCC